MLGKLGIPCCLQGFEVFFEGANRKILLDLCDVYEVAQAVHQKIACISGGCPRLCCQTILFEACTH